jgi:hypothetical protein
VNEDKVVKNVCNEMTEWIMYVCITIEISISCKYKESISILIFWHPTNINEWNINNNKWECLKNK